MFKPEPAGGEIIRRARQDDMVAAELQPFQIGLGHFPEPVAIGCAGTRNTHM